MTYMSTLASEVPEPDDLYEAVLGFVFGPSSFVVLAFLIVHAIFSWYQSGRFFLRAGRSARDRVKRVVQTPGKRRTVGSILTLSTLILQAVWLFTAYVVANTLSMGVGHNPYGRSDLSAAPLWEFLAALRWDWITQCYTAVAAAALAYSYWKARFDEEESTGFTIVLCMPLIPYFLFGTLGTVMILLDFFGVLNIYSGQEFTANQVLVPVVFGISSIAYFYACRASLAGPAMLAKFWTAPATAPPK